MGIENALDTGGWTCLHHAVVHGHIDLVLFMVKQGWDVLRTNQHMQRSSLRLAVDKGDMDMVRLLVQLGASWGQVFVCTIEYFFKNIFFIKIR